jgi:hypothetical protein
MAADFFVVPTVTYRLLFVLVILAHDRRRIVHVSVTDDPTAAWTAQQLRNAFPEDQAPRYLLHDRDAAFTRVVSTIAAMQIHEVVTAPRSPWQNAYVERLIGSIRRECLDHVIVLSVAGLQRVLEDYVAYYMNTRTHRRHDPPRRCLPDASSRFHRLTGCITATTARRRSDRSRPRRFCVRQLTDCLWRVLSGRHRRAVLRLGVMPPVAPAPNQSVSNAIESALSMPDRLLSRDKKRNRAETFQNRQDSARARWHPASHRNVGLYDRQSPLTENCSALLSIEAVSLSKIARNPRVPRRMTHQANCSEF